MCSSCGGKAKARLPGASAGHPVLFGEADGRPAQPVTVLVSGNGLEAGRYLYAAGDGVEQAVADGKIKLGYDTARRSTPTKPKATPFYVQTAPGRWIGFKNLPAAERYAKTIGSKVQTRDEIEGAS